MQQLIAWYLFQIGVRAGLYHGSTKLCEEKFSREKEGPSPDWNEYLEFDINMCDIPRMAKLCLGIYAKRKRVRMMKFFEAGF